MTHQRSENPAFVSDELTRCHAARPRTSSQVSRSAPLAWVFLIVGGLFLTGASAVYGQEKFYGPSDPVAPNPVSGRTVSIETITSADVLARVELFRAALEQIRLEMGQPKDQRMAIAVTNVAPREAVFQAMTLFRKASHLRVEVTGNLSPEVQITIPPDILPFYTWRVLQTPPHREATTWDHRADRRAGASGLCDTERPVSRHGRSQPTV